MKNIFLLIFLLFHFIGQCQDKAFAYIEKKELSAGILYMPKDSVYDFNFIIKNIGNHPLVILSVKTVCGCTVTHWSKKAIQPQQKETIKIQFRPDKFRGSFHRNIFVRSNATNHTEILVITGEVVDITHEERGINASINENLFGYLI